MKFIVCLDLIRILRYRRMLRLKRCIKVVLIIKWNIYLWNNNEEFVVYD